jgi:hypothetical protein
MVKPSWEGGGLRIEEGDKEKDALQHLTGRQNTIRDARKRNLMLEILNPLFVLLSCLNGRRPQRQPDACCLGPKATITYEPFTDHHLQRHFNQMNMNE